MRPCGPPRWPHTHKATSLEMSDQTTRTWTCVIQVHDMRQVRYTSGEVDRFAKTAITRRCAVWELYLWAALGELYTTSAQK